MKNSEFTINTIHESDPDLFDSHWLKAKYPERFTRPTLHERNVTVWSGPNLTPEFPFTKN
jgi:hypothetical protein